MGSFQGRRRKNDMETTKLEEPSHTAVTSPAVPHTQVAQATSVPAKATMGNKTSPQRH